MTTANVNIKKVLLRRGNTTQNNNYLGVYGEVSVDMEAKTLRIHDGNVAGGYTVTSGGGTDNVLRANVGAFQTYANANAATQTTEINSLRANITAANTAITNLTSNAAIQATLLDTLTGNAVTQSQVLDTLTSNAAAQATSLTTLLGNAVAQQTSLIDLIANAATQAQAIASVTGTYSNANVATYLSAFDGNILPSANVTYSLGSETRQWKDLWVSNNTIYIGNTPITVDGNTLLINNRSVSGSGDRLTNSDWTASLNDAGSLRVDNTNDEQNYFALTPIGNEDASYGLQIGIDNQVSWFFSNAGGITFPDDTVQTTAYTGGGNVSLPGLATSGSGTSNVAGNQVYALSINTESESDDEIALKVYAGSDNAGPAIAIGQDIGGSHRANVIAIGNYDVGYNSLPGGVYIGYGAGYNNSEGPQGLHSIAIGSKAAWDFATNNSITLNATGNELNPDESGLFIKPIRAEEYDDVILYYNPDSGEVTYANNTGVSALVTVGNVASGTEGALWYNTEDGRTYVYALDTWIDASPAVVPGNMVGYGQDGNITLNEDARINYANGVSIINSVYGDSQVADFLDDYTGNIAKIGASPLSIAAASVRLTSDNETWTFAPDGVIALPNGMTIESDGALGVNAVVTIGGNDTRIRIDDNGAPPGLYITANATGTAQQWVFGPDGDLAFPDGSFQTTAYTGGAGGTGNALVNGAYTVALQANGVLTIGANATISNDGEFRLWATDTDITVYRNGQDGYGVKAGNIEVYTDNALRTLTNSNGFELKTGNIIIPNDKGVVFANGVNILSTVGAGAYGNTQVASYLLNFDGDIEFTSSTAKIGNVDVITVMDSVQSPAYQFSNGGKITGIGNDLNIRTTTGVPSGPVTKISDNQGWGDGSVGTNLPTTGGTGTGLTVDVVDSGSAYAGISINTPGTGYTNGDVLTVTNGGMSDTFSISVPVYDWNFGANGNVVLPADGTITFANGVPILDTITGVTSINTSVSTLTVSDASGDYTYGALSYDYAVNGASNSFSIQYSAPLAFGNVDISVGNVTATGTANVANLIVSGTAPASLTGSLGDTAGMIRVDSNYIYYCTSTFVPASYTVGWEGAISNNLYITKGAYPTPQVGWTVTQNIYTFTIDSVTDNGSNWALVYTGIPYASPQGGTATLTNPVQPNIWTQTPLAATTYANTNVAAYLTTANISTTGNITAGNISVSGNLTVNNTLVNRVYLLEAYANVTYTLPGSFTEDTCRYSIVNNTVNVSSAWFNTSTYTFTPQKAGYWEITASYDVYRNSEASLAIKKNLDIVAAAGSFNAVAQQVTKIIYLNGSTDYINIINVGGAALSRAQYDSRSWFQARWVGA